MALNFYAVEVWNGRYFVRHCEVYGAVTDFGQYFGKLFA